MQAWHFLFILVFLVYILSDFFSQVVLQSPVNLDDPIYRRKVQRPLIAPLVARSVLGSHSRACDFARASLLVGAPCLPAPPPVSGQFHERCRLCRLVEVCHRAPVCRQLDRRSATGWGGGHDALMGALQQQWILPGVCVVGHPLPVRTLPEKGA